VTQGRRQRLDIALEPVARTLQHRASPDCPSRPSEYRANLPHYKSL
jgi:hypothetical protein